MTVNELRTLLADMPGDQEVVVIYESGSHLGSPERVVQGSTHYHPDGAVFLDCDTDPEAFDRTVDN